MNYGNRYHTAYLVYTQFMFFPQPLGYGLVLVCNLLGTKPHSRR